MQPPGTSGQANRAIVLLSGGIDSAVALHWALAEGWEVVPLTFDYHGRARRESEATEALTEHLGLDLLRVPLPFLAEVPDLPAGTVKNPRLLGAPEGYVPARNLVFYAIASFYAETLGAGQVVGGHHGGDSRRFPDASAAFFERLESAASVGVWSFPRAPFRFVLPLQELDKRGVLALGKRLGVPFDLTWSCYADGAGPCGECASCDEREDAFASAGLADPLLA